MADQKYSNSYRHRWAVPTVNVTVHGQSQSFDNKAPTGERAGIGPGTHGNHAMPHHQTEGPSVGGRMQPPTSSTSSAPNGIVTRSKHHAAGKEPTGTSNKPPAHSDTGRASSQESKEFKPDQNVHGKTVRHHARVHQGAVCNIPGKCQAGGELRLAHLAPLSSSVEYPSSFSLVGLKSPLLPGMTLVAAVDKRYLPDEETCVTMLGFSGFCVGCGAKGFRYFTEFSHHINLRLATQPKKQKHIKYYVTKDQTGRLRKGTLIPWKVEGRKRSMPMSGPYMMTTAEEEVPNDASSSSPASGPPQVNQNTFSAVSTTSASDTPGYPSQLSGPGYSHLPPKRSRWESGSENDAVNVYSGDEESSPAHSPAQDMSRIELPNKPWLTATCGVCPVLLLCQHSIPNVPCSVDDIIVSDLLVGCFDPPLVSDRNQFGNYSGAYNTQVPSPSMPSGDPYINKSPVPSQSRFYSSSSLTTQMAIILLIQHLSQLNEDDRLSREDIESLLQDAQLELSAGYQQPHVVAQSNLVTHVQLPILATLAAATSKGGVKIITSPVSLENAILRALKFIVEIIRHNQQKFPKVPVPDFIFILSTSQQKAPEFCVLVTGIHQARYLSEAMIGHPVGARITDNLGKLEQLFRLSSDALEQLVNSYEEVMGQGQLVYIPFNGYARMKIHADEAVRLDPKITVTSFQHYGKASNTVYTTQNVMAKQLVAQVCSMAENSSVLDISEFVKVDFTIVVPPIVTLFNQTAQRLAASGVLGDLELEEGDSASDFETAFNYVIKHDDCEETQEKLTRFLRKVHTQPKTLFVMVFDQFQFYSSPRGVLDLPYYKEFLEAFNVVPLFVTSAPYLFQSNRSFIDPSNEVYWSDAKTESDSGSVTSVSGDEDQYTDDQDAMYFGLKEYCDSIKWTHQFPLFRQDDAFERMALRTTRATDDVNVSVLRCYLLIRHYCAAIMWSAGIKPAEPHCTLKTIQIIREIIECPVRNADGSGAMLVIRIPSVELAVLAFDSLKNVRDRLGFQYRFCVIHDNGTGELEIEEYFLQRLRLWKARRGLLEGRSAEEWQPRCYEELLDLPCIVLLSGRERTGETFPRSLKYIDIRLIDRGFLYRSSLELEFSAIACYISTGAGSRASNVSESNENGAEGEEKDECSNPGSTPQTKTSHYSSNYPLPVVLVSRSAFKAFQTDFYGYPKHLLLPTTPQTRWIGHGRPHLVTPNPAHQSLYYRQWTEPKPKHLVGTQCSSMSSSRQVISMRSGSGIVISPDIPDVVEEDGMSAVETMAETRQASGAGSEPEDNSGEDKPDSPSQRRDKEETGSKSHRTAHDIRPGPTMVNMGTSSVASGSDTDPGGVGAITDEESDTEGGGSRYHPRSILFSGAPQVGKTGAYLHFTRLLYRMLIKLQRVDVYNEIRCTPDPSKQPPKDTSVYPDDNALAQMPFRCDLRQHCYADISPVSHHAQNSSQTAKPDSTRPVTSIMISPWSAHDICHHCESCKQYREGIDPRAAECYMYTLPSGEVLSFIIPPTQLSRFVFSDDKQVQSLRLPLMSNRSDASKMEVKTEEQKKKDGRRAVKTPIFTPSTGRHETGLLNLFHAMEGENHVHVVFVKHHEIGLYHKVWPNHVIVGLPQDSDKQGIGSARYFMKEFATENFAIERKRQDVDGTHGQDVWPLVMVMDDSCVMWQNLLQSRTTKTSESNPNEAPTASDNNTSLFKVLQYVEAMPKLSAVGAIGFQQFSTKASTPISRPSWSNTPLGAAVLLNIPATAEVQYDRLKYAYENIDWSLKLDAYDKLACCFNYITVAKKRIDSGGRPAFKMLLKACEEEGAQPKVVPFKSTDYAKFVTAPDTEDTHFFSAPAQYLLERYLAQASATKLFQSAADKPDRPVLVLNCYVNLGPRLTVEYLNSHKLQQEKSRGKGGEKKGMRYGGLLLYFSDETVTRQLLQQFQFTDDAQLCLVCQDRNTLRQEVVRLDLEEHWRFRLRDELQTANDPDEPSLFLLTGKHD